MSPQTTRPIAVDLFAGAGGLSLGLEQAGFDVLACVEYDPIHAAVHEYNFPYGTTLAMDASTVTGAMIRAGSTIGDQEITLVAGGPPCQGISLMGKRSVDDPRNALLKEFVRLVVELQPRYVLMENVAGLVVGDHRQLLNEVVDLLTAGGFDVRLPYKVLQAAEFGVPQSRRRLILLASRHGLPAPEYPVPVTRARTVSGGVAKQGAGLPLCPSVSQAISDLPDANQFPQLLTSDEVPTDDYATPSTYASVLRGLSHDDSDYSRPRLAPATGLTSSARTRHTDASVQRFAATRPGTTEKISRFLRLHPDGISNTLRAGTASDRGAHTAPRPIHPEHPRVITVREAARLHGYPDWFRFHVTKWNGFRQIGNSVPPPLARAVAARIMAADNLTPHPGSAVALGDKGLLSMNEGQAHAFFGISQRVIAQRKRSAA